MLRCFRMQRFEEKNKPNPLRWILPYIKPGSKRFLSWDKCRGLNFSIKDIFLWFSMWFCKKNVPKAGIICLQRLFLWINDQIWMWQEILSPKKNRSLVKESLAKIVASCSKLLFCKVTKEITQKGPTSNVKFYPLHLTQNKNLLDPGLI